MGSLANPLMIPGAANPSGTNLSMPAPFSGSTGSTAQPNPYAPMSSTSTTGSAASTNPYSAGFPAYGFPSSSTGGSGTGTTTVAPSTNLGALGTGSNPTNASTSSISRNLDKTFGSGLGSLLQNFLTSGAGYNPQVLQQLFAQLQPQFANQQQNLLQQFSASGNRFGSGAQTGYADLLGQQSLTEGDVAANLYEQSIQNFMSILTNASDTTAGRIQQTPTTLDNIGQVAGILSGAGSAAAGAYGSLGLS